MVMPENMYVNETGELQIGRYTLSDLAQEFGTPVKILDERHIRNKCRSYKYWMDKYYQNNEVVYAGKAFLCTAMCKIIDSENLYLDVVSGGELLTAIQANFPADKIIFHGNNKSLAELDLAMKNGVGRIVVDSLYELELLEKLTSSYQQELNILFRIKPEITANTHAYIMTGQQDSKFGLEISDDSLYTAVSRVISSKYLNLIGLHCHLGSQINEVYPYQQAVQAMIDLYGSISNKFLIQLKELNLGGGMGIVYTPEDEKIDVQSLLEQITETVISEFQEQNIPLPKLFIEPGRSIIGEAGIMLYQVGTIKENPGIRVNVSVDGGMTDNIRPALYNAQYWALVANKAGKAHNTHYTVVGKACESGDVLIPDIKLTDNLESGDLLAVFSCGAYTYAMASNYNRLPRPAVVLVNNDSADTIVERESWRDLLDRDKIPGRLQSGEG